MSTIRVDSEMSDYVVRSCTPQDDVVASLVKHTEELGDLYGLMTPIEEAAFLTLLARVTAARTVVDIGTFTGLSALSFARGVADGGRVITCDVSEEWIAIAREHWERAGVADRIEFRLGQAAQTLRSLRAGEVDIVFVDADKLRYPQYVEAGIELLRPGGLLILDNVLLEGTVVRPEFAENDLKRMAADTMRTVNTAVAADDRVEAVMLPIADGMTIARRK